MLREPDRSNSRAYRLVLQVLDTRAGDGESSMAKVAYLSAVMLVAIAECGDGMHRLSTERSRAAVARSRAFPSMMVRPKSQMVVAKNINAMKAGQPIRAAMVHRDRRSPTSRTRFGQMTRATTAALSASGCCLGAFTSLLVGRISHPRRRGAAKRRLQCSGPTCQNARSYPREFRSTLH